MRLRPYNALVHVIFSSVNVSQFMLDKPAYRLVTLAGNSTASNMAYSLTGRCLRTRLLAGEMIHSTRSSTEPEGSATNECNLVHSHSRETKSYQTLVYLHKLSCNFITPQFFGIFKIFKSHSNLQIPFKSFEIFLIFQISIKFPVSQLTKIEFIF